MAQKDFHHPFQPYDIQQEFMQAVYDCIEDSKVGIFESPTGTGKSLSLICGSLTWLREHKRNTFDASLQSTDIDDDEPTWLAEHARRTKHKEALALRAEFEDRLAKLRAQEAAIRRKAELSAPKRKRARLDDDEHDVDADDESLALDDYDSEAEHDSQVLYSRDTSQLLEKLGLLSQGVDTRTTQDQVEDIKVYFCSRTHSQLSQLVGELRRVRLPASLPPLQQSEAVGDEDTERLRQIALGSRRNLCINSNVNRLQSQTAINERCLDMQQANATRCPYLPKQDQPERLLDFRDSALADLRDIEDLALVGKHHEVCPYYASRTAIAPAEIITLPYQLLLQRASREALGISLKGSVVVIDEAHNLVSAVESAFTTQITVSQLVTARTNLIAYLQRFRNRLKGSNRVYVAQVVRLLDSMLVPIRSLQGNGGTLEPETLLQGKGVDQINLPKLVRYISESKLARKVESYATREKTRSAVNSISSAAQVAETPTLTVIANFVLSLINPAAEGSFFWSRDAQTVTLKYLLLDPSQHFREIVEEARAVILAGGTMSPMDDHIRQLFPYVPDVRTLSCGHIVPASSLLVSTLSRDALGVLEYNFKTRSDPALMQRTGRILIRLAQTVVGGMVVFFSSYAYLDLVSQEWQKSGITASLTNVKRLFLDSRLQSADSTFEAYSAAVRDEGRGAILCSVIGGKLSEGINFSDELGRCIVVIGLPFPNLETPEWKAKMRYLESKQALQREGRHNNISSEFAENTCMRAVNQAIGRAIRHRKDWASIVLIDSRYNQDRIHAKLPTWIRGSLRPMKSLQDETSDLCASMETFFDEHSKV